MAYRIGEFLKSDFNSTLADRAISKRPYRLSQVRSQKKTSPSLTNQPRRLRFYLHSSSPRVGLFQRLFVLTELLYGKFLHLLIRANLLSSWNTCPLTLQSLSLRFCGWGCNHWQTRARKSETASTLGYVGSLPDFHISLVLLPSTVRGAPLPTQRDNSNLTWIFSWYH